MLFFFFQAEDGIRDYKVTGVQTCALPICAQVTVFDASAGQLAQDRYVAEREGLALTCVQGDMRDLGVFADAGFDVIFHPISNLYVPDVRPVWRECARVLAKGGRLLSSFWNPVVFVEDRDPALREQGLMRDRKSVV